MMLFIADDLSGSCDIGLEFLNLGSRPIVLTSLKVNTHLWHKESHLIVNTQSRVTSIKDAKERVRGVLRKAGYEQRGIIFKKIDTALRGHVGAELDALLEGTGLRPVHIIPSIPLLGRVTLDGVQIFNGVPLHRTEYAHDPVNPVRYKSIREALQAESNRRIENIGLKDVRSFRLMERIQRLTVEGAEIIVYDSQTSEDVERIVKVLTELESPFMVAGSQGLAQGLVSVLKECGHKGGTGPQAPLKPWRRVLAVVGSAHSVSLKQVETARTCGWSLHGLDIDPGKEINREVIRAPADELAADSSPCLLVHAGSFRTFPSHSKRTISKKIEKALALTVSQVLGKSKFDLLMLTGGDTASSVIQELDIEVLRLEAKLAPLVGVGRVMEGRCRNMLVLIKGGSIGGEHFFKELTEWRKREIGT